MKINIPTRGEVELTELLKESSELRIKQPNIVVNSLVRELIDACEVIDKLAKSNTEKEEELYLLRQKNKIMSIDLALKVKTIQQIKDLILL